VTGQAQTAPQSGQPHAEPQSRQVQPQGQPEPDDLTQQCDELNAAIARHFERLGK
jgi:hypothetical protein